MFLNKKENLLCLWYFSSYTVNGMTIYNFTLLKQLSLSRWWFKNLHFHWQVSSSKINIELLQMHELATNFCQRTYEMTDNTSDICYWCVNCKHPRKCFTFYRNQLQLVPESLLLFFLMMLPTPILRQEFLVPHRCKYFQPSATPASNKLTK